MVDFEEVRNGIQRADRELHASDAPPQQSTRATDERTRGAGVI